jgi:hypothetical protein
MEQAEMQTPPKEFKIERRLFRPKFLHLAHHIHDQLLRAPLLIGGFYNWHRVLSGDFDLYAHKKGSLKDYDIIFLGLSRPEMEGLLISEIREEIGYDSKTLLVVCVDYAIEIWHQTFNMQALRLQLREADIVFTGEPKMRIQLEALINKPVFLLEHPTNTRILKDMVAPIEQRQNAVLCLIHRYNNDWIPPYLVVKDMPEIHNYAILLDGHPNNQVSKLPFFQFVRPGMEYPQWLEFLKQARVVVDSYHNMHTYGRNIVDCACLKVPVIASNIVHAQPILFPELTTEPNDVLAQRGLLKKLISDEKFYLDVVNYAYDKVDGFGYESSMTKFEQMIRDYEASSQG